MFVVRYATTEDLHPELQARLVSSIEAASRSGATALVFVVDPGIRTVDLSVPTFWLKVTGDARLGLAALAVVSRATAVRVAAAGFAAANVVRGVRFPVRGFEAEREAVAWALSAVAARERVPSA